MRNRRMWNRRSLLSLVVAALLGTMAGVAIAHEAVAAEDGTNCYTWMFCATVGGCKDADEYVGGCQSYGASICETPCP